MTVWWVKWSKSPTTWKGEGNDEGGVISGRT
jgi:hypothetical protein